MSHKPSAIDAIANEYTAKVIELSPMTGSSTGLGERHDVLDDFSPQGLDAYTQLDRETLAKLDEVAPTDAIDEVTVAAMRERLGLSIELAEAGEPLRNLNNIASTSQDIRDLFDLLPTESEQDWANISARLGDVKRALGGHVESLRLAASRGQVAASRQVRAVAGQAHNQAGESSSFLALVSSPETQALPESLRKELAANAASAQAAYGDFANFLETELLPQAGEQDGVGRERYQLFSREFLGATLDLDETYEWGRERLAAIDAEQREVARELYGEGVSVQEALKRLDEEPRYQQHGTDALKKWMQETADAAVAGLNGTHFDIPAPLQRIECCIAPSSTGGIYYTGPSDDFSRPGRMWWSVPAGTTVFNTWQERTTVFHEGVPGHHLQLGMQTYLRDELNDWRRHLCWVSGHGEGWALYAERLMADLGWQDDLGDRMGMLDSQRLRAARVVLDIGVHTGKQRPAELAALPGVGEGKWDRDSAWAYLTHNVAMAEGFLSFELERYLGWPGQAPAYAVGQRLWESIRDDAAAKAAREGKEFSLKEFHSRALAIGSVGLDVLREALS